MHDITRIFWDWDGVLGLQKFWHKSSEHNDELGDFVGRLFSDADLVRAWMRGEAALEDVSIMKDSPCSVTELQSRLVGDWSGQDAVNTPLFLELSQKHPSAKHYISTDNMDIFDVFASQSAFIANNFEKVYNSSQHGVLKDDKPGLYEKILEDLSLNDFTGALVLDDSAINCDRFRTLGGSAVLVSATP